AVRPFRLSPGRSGTHPSGASGPAVHLARLGVLTRGALGRLRCRAFALHDVLQSVIALVARVFVHAITVVAREAVLHRERRGPGHRVVDGDRIANGGVARAHEALRDLQGITCAGAVHSDTYAVSEIRGLDHERIAVPPTARIADIVSDRLAYVRSAIERHDARFVDHLVHDGHVARRLHYLVTVVVAARQNGSGEAACDAALVEREVRVRVCRSARLGAQVGRALLRAGH